MKAALIPPRGYFNSAARSDYHLALAQIAIPEYVALYSNLGTDDYIIMDNGAAEGQAVRDSVLLQRAMNVGTDEIVVPDVIRDADATIERANRFFGVAMREPKWQMYSYMGVVQGTGDNGSIMKCIEAFCDMPIDVLGIPRHLVDYDRFARYNILSLIKGYGYHKRFQVHLLGTNPKAPAEVANIVEVHPWVRGVDSSLPYNYAIAGVELTTKQRQEPIARPDHYFEKIQPIDASLLQDNIATFMRWARGTEGTAS